MNQLISFNTNYNKIKLYSIFEKLYKLATKLKLISFRNKSVERNFSIKIIFSDKYNIF